MPTPRASATAAMARTAAIVTTGIIRAATRPLLANFAMVVVFTRADLEAGGSQLFLSCK
jgi:hypothetical protein